MLVELGVDAFVSFQTKLYPERLVVVAASASLSRDNLDAMHPSGTYTYQNPMTGTLPMFCLHPFDPKPAPSTTGSTAWTWFTEDLGNGFWSIDLTLEQDTDWGLGLSFHEETPNSEMEFEEVFSIWLPLPGYKPEHHELKSQIKTPYEVN